METAAAPASPANCVSASPFRAGCAIGSGAIPRAVQGTNVPSGCRARHSISVAAGIPPTKPIRKGAFHDISPAELAGGLAPFVWDRGQEMELKTDGLLNLGRIEALLTRAAALDPGVDQGGPVRVLGMLYIQAPAWPQGIGDPDRGLGLLRYAAHHFPAHPMNHLFLAQALWEVEGEDALPTVTRAVCRALRLAGSGDWGRAGEDWGRQARDLADEAGVQCP